jgi:phage-related protein
MLDKPLIWLGSSLRDLLDFPARARRLAGFQLRRVQQGLDPDDWKPMRTVGLESGRSGSTWPAPIGCST